MNSGNPNKLLHLTLCLCCLLVCCEQEPVNGQQAPASIAQLFDQSCLDCHDSSSKEGDLDLESLRLDLDDADNFHIWERVFDRVADGEMPPNDSLGKQESAAFLSDLNGVLKKADAHRIATSGRVPARRLTRAQYERNVCELLAIDIPLREFLPVESLTNGFDTVSKSQQISDHSMSALLNSADVALETSFNRILAPTPPWKVRLDWTQLRRDEESTNREPEGRPKHKDIVSWSTRQNFYGRMPATTVPVTGRYRIRVRVQAVHPPEDGRVWCSFRSGVCSAKASAYYWIGSFEATAQPKEYEYKAWVRKDHKLQIVPNDRGLKVVSPKVIKRPAGTIAPMGIPGVAIKWIEIELIKSDQTKVRKALIGDLKLKPKQIDSKEEEEFFKTNRYEIVSANPQQDLKKLTQRFAQQAFRRPVSTEELKPYFEFAFKRFKATGSFGEAIRAAYRTILCSSRFLYFEEPPGKLDEHALANRLSHFLWGIGPDKQLRDLAKNGQLNNPETLRQQTDRLLADSRAKRSLAEFTDQWLMLYEINSTTPDGKLYPEYDEVLHHSLRQETHAFVQELVAKDSPVTDIVDSNFTFLNSRLARHYDIEWPGGLGLRRVAISPEDRRGGLITHASILKVTANGTTTSPITRGVWMLERIIGEHVPPPPANVPAVEPDIRGATTIRDELDKHRNLESCAACHVKIDPPGFALESFDVIGGWRENYRIVGEKNGRWSEGPLVDPSHQLASGESFENIQELKKFLLRKPDQLARNMASQFITYATGAAPTFADRDAIEAIVEKTKSKNYGVRSLLHEVIQSSIFRNK